VILVVDKIALGQVFLLVFRFCLVTVIPSMLLTHLDLPVAHTETTNVSRLGTFQKEMLFWKSGFI
jgi:hypothetical protein